MKHVKPEDIEIPEGMSEAYFGAPCSNNGELRAALAWLANNPIEPTGGELRSLLQSIGYIPSPSLRDYETVMGWQRRMFLKKEPPVPEELKGLMVGVQPENLDISGKGFNELILKAYELGKASKK